MGTETAFRVVGELEVQRVEDGRTAWEWVAVALCMVSLGLAGVLL